MCLFLQDSKHKPSIGKNIPDKGRGENGPWLWVNQWEHFTDMLQGTNVSQTQQSFHFLEYTLEGAQPFKR